MLKTRLILLASLIILVVALYQLPKVVVDSDEETVNVDSETSAVDSIDPMHDLQLQESDLQRIESLSNVVNKSGIKEKRVIFADSLAQTYFDLQKYDSAAKYFDILVSLDSNLVNLEKSGNAYYEAFTYAMDQQSAITKGNRAKDRYETILSVNPERLDLKTKVAMTYMSTQNPMMGITMLNEVLDEDEYNTDALFNLGILAIQTGQYERATERLEKLKQADPGNVQGRYYLALSYKETGRREEAVEELNEVKSLSDDTELNAIIDSLLEELNN